MKRFTCLFLLLFALGGYSQKTKKANSIYTNCKDEIHKDACLYAELQKQILTNYDKKAIALIASESAKDTISISASLAVSNDGSLDLQNSTISSPDDYIDTVNTNILENLDDFILQLDEYGNPLSELLFIRLYFLLNRSSKMVALEALPFGGKYTTENIAFEEVDEVPVFPGCEKRPNNELRKCFNEMISDHIRQHFRYPKKAQRKRITGRVNIMFLIDKKGSITHIQTFGADPILMKEARRIIEKLPQMTPGKVKGRLVRVPFALPLTFKI